MSKNPLTDADRALFKQRVRHWLGVLGLHDWRLHFSTKPSAHMAEVSMQHPDRLATVKMGRNFGDVPVTGESLDDTALHEVLHVLLCELVNQQEYGIRDDALTSAEHRVVIALGSALRGGAPL